MTNMRQNTRVRKPIPWLGAILLIAFLSGTALAEEIRCYRGDRQINIEGCTGTDKRYAVHPSRDEWRGPPGGVHYLCQDGIWRRDCARRSDPVEATHQSRDTSTRPTDASAAVLARCERKWPDNFEMQLYCVEQQKKAANSLRIKAQGASGRAADILNRCSAKWADGDTWNFEMVEYCYDQQIEAMHALDRQR